MAWECCIGVWHKEHCMGGGVAWGVAARRGGVAQWGVLLHGGKLLHNGGVAARG